MTTNSTDRKDTTMDSASNPDPAGFTDFRTTVASEWVDYNGHMNDSAYSVVCTAANEAFLEHLGLSAAYRERTGAALYTVEAHLRFLRECREGETIAASSVVESFDAKRLWVRTMLLGGTGAPVFEGRYLYLHVGPDGVTPFPPDRVGVLAAAPTAPTGDAASPG